MEEGFTIKNTFRDMGRGLLVGLAGLTAVFVLYLFGMEIERAALTVTVVGCTGAVAWVLWKGSYNVYLTIGFWTKRYIVTQAEMPVRYWLGVSLIAGVTIYFGLVLFGWLPMPSGEAGSAAPK